MAEMLLLKETRSILKEMNVNENREGLFCPVMRVLKMRHSDLDKKQAKRVLQTVLAAS